jgi:aspartate aminotransferase-like enzyme
MGYNSRPACVFLALTSLEQVLRKQGAKVELGAGVAAAEKVYAGG